MKTRTCFSLAVFLILTAIGVLISQDGDSASIQFNREELKTPGFAVMFRDFQEDDPSGWITFTSRQQGLVFQYPPAWKRESIDAEAVDLSNSITVIANSFVDTLKGTTLLIAYHLAPMGAKLYSYAVSQFNSSQGRYERGGRKSEVAGNIAIEADTEILYDGKGRELNPPLRLVVVTFQDREHKGTFEIQFKTPLPEGDAEVAKLRKLLLTIRFIDNSLNQPAHDSSVTK
jgi:hypothetical protein